MKYIALTQAVASWLLTQPKILSSLHGIFLSNETVSALKHADLSEGALRISGSKDGRIVAVWNTDYLTGTGLEQWGIVKLTGPFGLSDNIEISREVFEREIYIINQRLQSLLLDSAFHHRTLANGVQTCMAGRGTIQRQYSVGYVESDVSIGQSRTRAILCIGPSDDFERLGDAALAESHYFSGLVTAANDLIAPQRRRAILDQDFPQLRVDPTEKNVSNQETLASAALTKIQDHGDVYRTLGWTYDDWIDPKSPLSSVQRRILIGDGILKSPIRIMGPGGSGKTLLMQLLAIRRLQAVENSGQNTSVLYVVHNAQMANLVREKFESLGASKYLKCEKRRLRVTTLSDYGKTELDLQEATVIDIDAHETKEFQLAEISQALRTTLNKSITKLNDCPILSQAATNEDLFSIFARLVMAEISTAIKGHGLVSDKQRYVGSERPLSRLHGILNKNEREIVFETFRVYHQSVFEELEVLDSDDIAISLMGKMRTPIWELKRRTLGFDFVFVDETQLFNENERRLFPLLTKTNLPHVPIVFALDEAQELYGQTTAGFGALGINAITNENLPSNFRSTRAIVDLAFFVIQQTTDLFGPDFPDFTDIRATMEPDDHKFATPPRLEVCNVEAKNLGRFVVKRVRDLRSMQLRQIAVVCHAEHQWVDLKDELQASDLPLHILTQRGERLPPGQPAVILTRPAYVGGQEFDAVVAVGLEQGVVPPRVHDNEALSMAVEQQALREMYLAFTRARYQLLIVISHGTKPTAVIKSAIAAGLVSSQD